MILLYSILLKPTDGSKSVIFTRFCNGKINRIKCCTAHKTGLYKLQIFSIQTLLNSNDYKKTATLVQHTSISDYKPSQSATIL